MPQPEAPKSHGDRLPDPSPDSDLVDEAWKLYEQGLRSHFSRKLPGLEEEDREILIQYAIREKKEQKEFLPFLISSVKGYKWLKEQDPDYKDDWYDLP